MSVATEKENMASERFLLVRFNPSRLILPELDTGTIYSMTFLDDINRLERNGVALTKVTGSLTTNQWRYNEATKLLEVSLASAPNETTNIIIANFYLYFTGTEYRAIGQNPEAPTDKYREWLPKIVNYPSILQSVNNIIYGVFSINDMQIQLIDEDGYLKQRLSDYYSFYNKDVQIWLCINDVSNIQRVYVGTVRSVAFSNSVATFSCVDRFNTFKQLALMGDTSNEAYFLQDPASFPNLDANAHGKTCPYIVGTYSRFVTESVNIDIGGITTALDMIEGHPAYCTSFTNNFLDSTNRTWGCSRQDTAVRIYSIGTITATAEVSGTNGFSYVKVDSYSGFTIGDTLKWRTTGSSDPFYYGIVAGIGNYTVSGTPYNLLVNTLGVKILATSMSFSVMRSFAVLIKNRNGDIIRPVNERDYVLTETTTSGGNNFVSIVFNSNFESRFVAFFDPAGYLDPREHTVEFRTSVQEVDNQYNPTVLFRFCQEVGLPANSASFSEVQDELPVLCRFHIPYFDEGDYKNYLDYAQDILASTLGYLTLDSNFQVNYRLFKAPEIDGAVRDPFLTLQGNTSTRVDYADIATQIIAYNPHCDSALSLGATLSPSETRESARSQFLNSVVNVDRFRHVLEEITSRIDAHMGLKSRPRTIYRFATATQDIDTELGDDLTLDNKIVLGETSRTALKVTGIDKSPSRVVIEASDLKGL